MVLPVVTLSTDHTSVYDFWCSDLPAGTAAHLGGVAEALDVIRVSTGTGRRRHSSASPPRTDSTRVGAIPPLHGRQPVQQRRHEDDEVLRHLAHPASAGQPHARGPRRPVAGDLLTAPAARAHTLNPHAAVHGRDRSDGRSIDPDARRQRPSARLSRPANSGFGNSRIVSCGRHRCGEPGGSDASPAR